MKNFIKKISLGLLVSIFASIAAASPATNNSINSGGTSITVNGTSIPLGSSGTAAAAAGTLTGSTLASGVTASSLTSFGSSPTFTTPNIGSATGTTLALSGQARFSAYRTSDLIGVTGDGTGYQIPFNATTANQGSGFNTSTGKFTTPFTGFGLFIVSLDTQNIQSDNNVYYLTVSDETQSTSCIITDFGSMHTLADGSLMVQSGSCMLPVTANDVISSSITITGHATKNITLSAQSATTTFSGIIFQ